MQARCDTDPRAFDALQSEWEALLPRTATNTTFLRPFWQRAWWNAYGVGKDLRLWTVRDEGGQLLGVAPLFLHEMKVPGASLMPRLSIERPMNPPDGAPRRILHPIGGTEVSDYLDLVVDREHAARVYRALWEAVREELRGGALLDLHCIPDGSPTLQWLPELARADGYQVAVDQEEVCPIICLPSTWEEYLDSLDKKQRHEIRRKIRKAAREARIAWRKTQGAEELEADLGLFFRLHEHSDPEKAAFWNEETRQFFREIAAALQTRGMLSLSFIYFDDEPAATYLCFEERGAVLVYNSGFDPNLYLSLSPGLVLLSYLIDDAIHRGCKAFDLLRGNERYKYDHGGVDTAIYRMGIAG